MCIRDRIKGKCSYKLEIGKDPVGNMQRIHNTLSSIDRKLTESEQKVETVQQQLATAQEEVKKPFPKEAELNEKIERLSELNALLNMDEKGTDLVTDRIIRVALTLHKEPADDVIAVVGLRQHHGVGRRRRHRAPGPGRRSGSGTQRKE